MKTHRITGGKAGFAAAVSAAYSSRMVNPCVRYSASRGFHAESAVHRADSDVVWSARCDYFADTGKRTVGTYAAARTEIMEALEQ